MREMSTNNKKLVILAIFVLVAVGILGYLSLTKNKTQAFEFEGMLSKVEGGDLYLEGSYYVEGKLTSEKKSVKVNVSDTTKYEKIIWHMPTADELRISGGRWNSADLKKDTEVGRFNDLQNEQIQGRSVKIKSEKNIFNKESFDAVVVTYIEEQYVRNTGQPFQSPQVIIQP